MISPETQLLEIKVFSHCHFLTLLKQSDLWPHPNTPQFFVLNMDKPHATHLPILRYCIHNVGRHTHTHTHELDCIGSLTRNPKRLQKEVYSPSNVYVFVWRKCLATQENIWSISSCVCPTGRKWIYTCEKKNAKHTSSSCQYCSMCINYS